MDPRMFGLEARKPANNTSEQQKQTAQQTDHTRVFIGGWEHLLVLHLPLK